MIEGESFVYYGPEPWQSMWRNRHQLLTRLARANKVVYVEPRPYVEEVLAEVRRGDTRLVRLARAARVGLERANLWVYRPAHFAPLGGPGPVRAVSHAIRRATLRRDLAALGVATRTHHPIVWISTPTQHDARFDLPARLRVYHIVDDYLGYFDLPATHRDSYAKRERELIDWADLVVAVSPELISSKGAGNDKFRLLPNGFDAVAYATDRPPAVPDALAALPRPILGYVGLISVRLDLELLDELARTRPEWTFVFMGAVIRSGCGETLDRLEARPNVHLLPPARFERVADFVRSFDLGLVPYRVTQETIHASPLKLYEYLAAGLPVVAADVPGARQFAPLVSIASTPAGWEAAICEALAPDDESRQSAKRAARRAAVRSCAWDARVETLSGFLLDALA